MRSRPDATHTLRYVTQRRSTRSIFLFWVPLAATWLMMAVEGPFIAAVIARLPDEKYNLAAYGVAFAFAVLTEAPVMMLMSAATALVKDGESFRRLRNFSRWLGAGTTLLVVLILVPPVYRWLTISVIEIPARVADLTYGALWFFLPWPAAIGYRRFLQGVLIRSDKTRLVALGTVVRLFAMAGTGVLGALFLHMPGAWVGTLALAVGVCAEALAARIMAAATIRELLGSAKDEPDGGEVLGYRDIAHFYYPLALTSLMGIAVQPMLTFFMGRAPQPVDSLAVFPVVQALSFVFRSLGLSFQDAGIALMGDRHEHFPELKEFAVGLGIATVTGIGLVAYTPLAHVWFGTISGLSRELEAVALVPARVILPLPALSMLLSLQRAILVKGHRTRPITVATATEVSTIALVFLALGWGLGVIGATAAFTAFTVGRGAANLYLMPKVRAVLRESRSGRAADEAPVAS